eukprot:m.155314 g.155314  ORF g.155314 m.155314 type:complete len:67 (+) comp24655_c0_seq8:995-1195(+)
MLCHCPGDTATPIMAHKHRFERWLGTQQQQRRATGNAMKTNSQANHGRKSQEHQYHSLHSVCCIVC